MQARPDLRPEALYLFGHSGGGVIARLYALLHPGFAGIVLENGVGLTGWNPPDVISDDSLPALAPFAEALSDDQALAMRATRWTLGDGHDHGPGGDGTALVRLMQRWLPGDR